MKKKIFSTRFEPATVKSRNLDREREREKEERERGRDFEGVIYCFFFFGGGGVNHLLFLILVFQKNS